MGNSKSGDADLRMKDRLFDVEAMTINKQVNIQYLNKQRSIKTSETHKAAHTVADY
jgi:hypothetical protein